MIQQIERALYLLETSLRSSFVCSPSTPLEPHDLRGATQRAVSHQPQNPDEARCVLTALHMYRRRRFVYINCHASTGRRDCGDAMSPALCAGMIRPRVGRYS